MGYLLDSLKTICNDEKLREKVIIMPSYAEGNQLIEAVVKEGFSLLNLKTETLVGLAKNQCLTYIYKNNYSIIDDSLAMLYTYRIFKKLQKNSQLKYFDKIQINPGFVKAIYNTIYELRMTGFTSQNLTDNSFINLNKAADMRVILENYEEVLNENKFIDEYALYNAAIENTNDNTNDEIYIIPSNMKLRSTEIKFLEVLSKGNIHIIGATKIPEIEMPKFYYINSILSKISNSEPKANNKLSTNPLNYLYDIDNLPTDLRDMNIKFVSAYGKSNESKEVI